jgi:hypothetical protein
MRRRSTRLAMKRAQRSGRVFVDFLEFTSEVSQAAHPNQYHHSS